MESTLFQSAFARGEARGEATVYRETTLRILALRTGAVDPAVTERVRAMTDLATLKAWLDEALLLNDAEAASKLAAKIRRVALP